MTRGTRRIPRPVPQGDGHHDAAHHDAAHHDAAHHDAAHHDAAHHDAAHHDAARSEAAPGSAARYGAARRGAVQGGPWWRWAAGLAVVAALAGVAGWGFHRVFPGTGLLLAVVPAAVAPAAVAALTRTRPLWLALALDLVLWLAGTIPLYGTLSATAPADVANAWHALLTTLLPAQPEPELLVLVHTLVWAAATIGAETLTRTATRIAAALPALAVYGVALLLGVDGEGSNLPVAAALFVLMATLALIRDGRSPAWLLGGIPAAAALAGLALVAAPLLPIAAEPYNPRQDADLPPPARVDSVSPLDRVSAWLQIPDRELFTVEAGKPQNWRLAVLDRYDGVRWTSGARFRPTGGRVPEGEWTGAADVVRQRITFGGLPGTWLPAAERPEQVTGVRGLTVDPASGSLLAGTKPAKGFSYEVTSRVPRPTKQDLLAAAPARDASLTAFPDGPQERLFRRLAQQAVKGAGEPIRQAYRLQSYLRTNAAYDVTAPPRTLAQGPGVLPADHAPGDVGAVRGHVRAHGQDARAAVAGGRRVQAGREVRRRLSRQVRTRHGVGGDQVRRAGVAAVLSDTGAQRGQGRPRGGLLGDRGEREAGGRARQGRQRPAEDVRIAGGRPGRAGGGRA
ncbi:hypothetical protein GCM10020220_100150 [Nonomuraea rubra]